MTKLFTSGRKKGGLGCGVLGKCGKVWESVKLGVWGVEFMEYGWEYVVFVCSMGWSEGFFSV